MAYDTFHQRIHQVQAITRTVQEDKHVVDALLLFIWIELEDQAAFPAISALLWMREAYAPRTVTVCDGSRQCCLRWIAEVIQRWHNPTSLEAAL